MVDEVDFVLARGFPLRRLPGSQQCFHIVKPKFRHAVIVRLVFVARNSQAVALDQSAQSWDASTNWSVDVLPVVKELLVGQTCLLGDAINELDHNQYVRLSKQIC